MGLVVVFASFLLIGASQGQSGSKLEWGPDELENPINKAMKCGHDINDPAYICDPNRIIESDKDLEAINWFLKDVAFNSSCPCSNHYCETTSKPTGYRIGVALVPRMKVLKSIDRKIISPSDQAQIFAYTLENTKWNMGNCEEDIVVFYSKEDKTLAIYSGLTASTKLTPYYKDLIAYKVGSRLDEGKIVEALIHIIHDIKLVLKCDSTELYDCNLYEFNPDHASCSLASLSFVLGSAILAIFSQHLS